MRSLTRRNRTDVSEWEDVEEKSPTLIRSAPLLQLVADIRRRMAERREELPGSEPAVSLATVGVWLAAALDEAGDLDEWIPTAEAASMVRVSDQTIRNRIANGTLDQEPGPNGGFLVNRGQVLEAFGLGPISQKQDLAA